MKVIEAKLDYSRHWERPDIYLFTGNSTIRKDGAIVMGRGAARQCRDSFFGIDHSFGSMLKECPQANLLFTFISPGQWLGWFKVKEYWADKAQLKLIEESVRQLKNIAEAKEKFRYHMNYPGIGNGGLTIEQVEPLLQVLPDNVTLYR